MIVGTNIKNKKAKKKKKTLKKHVAFGNIIIMWPLAPIIYDIIKLFDNEPRYTRHGVVIWDNTGMILASMSKKLPQIHMALEIEALEALTALVFASDLGFYRVS